MCGTHPTGNFLLTRGQFYSSIWREPFTIVGVFNGEGPPVPIPNTEVKLTSADNTCLETDREDRSMPTQGIRSGESLAYASLAQR
jgi:hypothetical protein